MITWENEQTLKQQHVHQQQIQNTFDPIQKTSA